MNLKKIFKRLNVLKRKRGRLKKKIASRIERIASQTVHDLNEMWNCGVVESFKVRVFRGGVNIIITRMQYAASGDLSTEDRLRIKAVLESELEKLFAAALGLQDKYAMVVFVDLDGLISCR